MSVDDRIRAGLKANVNAFQPEVESSLDRVRRRGRDRRIARTAMGVGLVAAASIAALLLTWPDPPDEVEPLPPRPSPTSELFGRYEATVTRPVHLSGHWVLELKGNGTVNVSPPEEYAGVVSGTLLTADGTTLRTNLFMQDVCADLGNGEFSWRREGTRLELEVSDDPCAARRQFFADNAWFARAGP